MDEFLCKARESSTNVREVILENRDSLAPFIAQSQMGRAKFLSMTEIFRHNSDVKNVIVQKIISSISERMLSIVWSCD